VTGATGYIGGRLVPRLTEKGHAVRVLARDAGRLEGRFSGVEVAQGDLFDRASVGAALAGIDVAYYLVHSMARDKGDFAASDRELAAIFGTAARDAGVRRIIYLGGLGEKGRELSHHLRSRHEVGEILREAGVPVTEFRAAMIVGAGSASFEMLRYLTERLPVMIAPKWVDTPCQPIAVRDVLAYLVAELQRTSSGDDTFEIGGADVLSYKAMMMQYAAIRGLRRSLVVVPFFTPRLSSAWVHLVTPIPASIARPLIDGLRNPVVVRNPGARAAFPGIKPMGYDEAVTRALDRYSTVGPQTTWFDAYDARTLEFPGNHARHARRSPAGSDASDARVALRRVHEPRREARLAVRRLFVGAAWRDGPLGGRHRNAPWAPLGDGTAFRRRGRFLARRGLRARPLTALTRGDVASRLCVVGIRSRGRR
jgi:uncharacterized protein YbjT (DUF2867 family)